ncbi:cytidine/deoxycytidylate deaminase family protein [Nemania sp. FL0031]|nr:cytidine/deoxycytidylate deaminase family protein [Nemania sp. FL0031]
MDQTATPPDTADDLAKLLSSLLAVTENNIVGLMKKSVSEGNLPFAAAVFSKQGLTPLQISVNKVTESPLLHGETNCIREFFALPKEKRPAPDRCVFFATHEPCSLCLSGIAWTGFPIVYYLFSYEDTRDLLGIGGDIDILEEVFRVPTTGEPPTGRPFYNKNNRFFTAKSISELVAEVEDENERVKLEVEVDRVRSSFDEFRKTQ